MKFKNKNSGEIIEAHLWNPQEPASQRPKWFNDLAQGEIVLEANDSISLPFPAIASVLPGQYLVKLSNGELRAVMRKAIDGTAWEPVQE